MIKKSCRRRGSAASSDGMLFQSGYRRNKISFYSQRCRQYGNIADSARLYRELVNFLPEPLLYTDLQGTILLANQYAAIQLGYSHPKELLGLNGFQFISPDEQSRLREDAARTMRGLSADNIDFIIIRKDGSQYAGQVIARLVRDHAGKPRGFSVLIRDVAASKAAQAALRASEERFRTLVETSPDGIVAFDLSGTITDCNQSDLLIFGYQDREEILGRKIFEFMPPNEIPRAAELMTQVLRHGETVRAEFILLKKDGSTFLGEVNGCLILNAEGIPQGYMVITRDITERRKSEEALRANEARLRLIYENMTDEVCQIDQDDRVIFVSPSIKRMTGYEVEDLLGKNVMEHVHPDFLAGVIDTFLKVLRSHGDFVRLEYPYYTKHGEYIWFESESRLLYDEDGNYCGAIFGTRNINDRKKGEEEILRLNAELEARVRERTGELEQALREMEAFSYSISHDLRAPLRALNSYSAILDEEFSGYLPDQARKYLRYIQRNSLYMDQLIRDLLMLSRTGRAPLERKHLKMGEIVQKAIDTLTGEQNWRSVELIQHDLPDGWGDPTLVQQVWYNLLSNAMKYTSKAAQPRIEIGSQGSKDDRPIYYVRDNGIGFDMQYASVIFGVFQRLHHDGEFEGTGVGLAIVQRVILRHGGEVWAESEPGQGSTFYFHL